MGIEIPEDWPTLQDNLWYKCYVDRYEAGPVPQSCDNVFIDSKWCCLQGAQIKAWIAADQQCKNNPLCTGLPPGNSQRLMNITGPSDTWALCWVT
ncbi:hypothetical protein KAR91_48620 [Candidatus Pacearchaeota archaeon]|nr:hypothetical protein [Candidatus Pacearchaeota archaeon]